MVFGRRSEKRHDDAMNDTNQGFLFPAIVDARHFPIT